MSRKGDIEVVVTASQKTVVVRYTGEQPIICKPNEKSPCEECLGEEMVILRAVDNLDCDECAMKGCGLCHLLPCMCQEREDRKSVGWVQYHHKIKSERYEKNR